MKQGFQFIWSKLRNKYFVAVLFFIVWMLFFDEHSLVFHMQNKIKLHQLEEQKDYYREKIQVDKRKLKELQTSDQNLEKFAREQFLMKKENEDVFVIIEEE